MTTIGTKMSLGFGSMTLLMVSAIGAGLWATHSATSGFAGLLSDENTTALLSVDAKAMLLEQRRSEKDFLARKEVKYAKLVDEAGVRLLADIDSLLAVAAERRHDELATEVKQVEELAKTYQAEFTTVVAAEQEHGLTEDAGLIGKLAATASKLSAKFQANAIGPFYIQFLQLRMLAEDRARDADWSRAWNACAAAIDAYSQRSPECAGIGSHLHDLLNTYGREHAALIQSAQATPAIDQAKMQTAHASELQGTARAIDESVSVNYIPGIEELDAAVHQRLAEYLLSPSEEHAAQVDKGDPGGEPLAPRLGPG